MSVLKVLSSVHSLMCLGRMFQRKGAAAEKALSPQVQCLVLCGGVRRFVSGWVGVMWSWMRVWV